MRNRWRGDLGRFQDEVNKLVEESLSRVSSYLQTDGESRPVADLYENEKELLIFVELPGIQKEDINISLLGRTLTLTAEKQKPEADEEELRVAERSFGKLRRSFELDHDIDVDAIDAGFLNGILRLVIPKIDSKARKIEITIE